MNFTSKTLAALTLSMVSAVASATPLSDYNLILFGDLAAVGNVHVDGRAFIGGNFTNGTDFANHLDASYNTQDTLEVGGNINITNLSVSKGYLAHGGTITGNVNCNGAGLSGGACVRTATGLDAKAADLYTQLKSESDYYAGLVDSLGSGLSGDNNNKSFVYTGAATDLAVFSISAADLFAVGGWNIALGNAQNAVINVTGSLVNQAGKSMNMNINQSLFDNILWNFNQATNINFLNQWNGSVLAVDAEIDTRNNFNGSVAAQRYVGSGEFHLGNPSYHWTYTPPTPPTPPTKVPEPSLLILLLTGLGLLSLGRLRRR